MKKIGKEVLRLTTSKYNPRNGESTFLRCRDGSILLMFTEYCSTCNEDHGEARISGCRSYDEGESWSPREVLFEKDPAAQNIMSPSLIRLPNGDMGVCYLRKDKTEYGGYHCMPVFRSSPDEGKTWTDFVFCTDKVGYYCGINDGAIMTKAGRILFPMSCSGREYAGTHQDLSQAELWFLYSDDNGKTWGELTTVRSPYVDNIGLAEPGIYEMEDGTLWTWARTGYGYQYQSFSKDGGKTWTAAMPNFNFSSPDSPMRVKKAGRYVVAVHNPIAYTCLCERYEEWNSPKRSPIVAAFSSDDGKSFDTTGKTATHDNLFPVRDRTFLLEDDYTESYCYPAIIGTKDGLLVSYYYSAGSTMCLNQSKVMKIYKNEYEE